MLALFIYLLFLVCVCCGSAGVVLVVDDVKETRNTGLKLIFYAVLIGITAILLGEYSWIVR